MNAQLFLLLQSKLNGIIFRMYRDRFLKIWKKSEKDHQKQIKFKQVQLKI